jgi:hypothetical protein
VISNPSLHALRLLERCGLDDPTKLPLQTIVQGLGAYYHEKPLKHCEGRIVTVGRNTLITINSEIPYEGKKRYAIAHELGHFEMHRDRIPIVSDTEESFVDWLKAGPHEREANEFAAEFLMPREIFARECKGKKISPDLIRYLSARFQTSITSTLLRYIEFGNHQACLVYCKNNKMKWRKWSKDFYHRLNFQYNSHPPTGSVAYEMFTKGVFYADNEQNQQIWKSDWFDMNDEADKPFFEFCVFVPSYNYSISLIWEENKKSKYSI